MERNGYDYRHRRPFEEVPLELRRRKEFSSVDRSYPSYDYRFRPKSYSRRPNISSRYGYSHLPRRYENLEHPKYSLAYERRPGASPLKLRTPYSSQLGYGVYQSRTPPTYYVPYTYSNLNAANSWNQRYKRDSAEELARKGAMNGSNMNIDSYGYDKMSRDHNIPPEGRVNIREKYEQPMDPKEFKEQCRRTYLEAAAERQRNADLSVWRKCDWATYDKYDDRYNIHRR